MVSEWTKVTRENNSSIKTCNNLIHRRSQTGLATPHLSRVPNDEATFIKVRDYIVERRIDRMRVCTTEVLEFLINEKLIELPKTSNENQDEKSIKAAHATVLRYLKRRWFLRGKQKGSMTVNSIHTAWRNQFLRVLLENRRKPRNQRMCEIYTDESYIHHHHRHIYQIYFIHQ